MSGEERERERGGDRGRKGEREEKKEEHRIPDRPTNRPLRAPLIPLTSRPTPALPHQPDLTKPPSTHFCFPFPINCLLLFTYLPYRTLFFHVNLRVHPFHLKVCLCSLVESIIDKREEKKNIKKIPCAVRVKRVGAIL